MGSNNRNTAQDDNFDESGNEKKLPYGDAFAVVGEDGRNQKADWIQLGPVWPAKDGGFSLELKSEPLAWRNASTPRRIVILKRRDRE